MAATNVTFHHGLVSPEDRARLLRQQGCIVWLTGLSGSGKSTIARAVERELLGLGKLAYVLDGDNLRHGLNSDLGFSSPDRSENIRRVAHVAAILADAGVIAISALISPMRSDREAARTAAGKHPFVQVFVNTPLEVCESRDPKQLYARARSGEILEFTGISSPYEPPETADLEIDTATTDVDGAVNAIVSMLTASRILNPPGAEQS